MLNASSITMYDTSKASVKNREADWFSKISSLGIKPCVSVPENAVYVWTEG